MATKRRPTPGYTSGDGPITDVRVPSGSAPGAIKAPTSSTFSLEDELDALNYDFRPYVESHGTIPEPSSAQIKALQSAMRSALKPALESLSVEADTANVADLIAALAEPTKADLKAAAKAELAIVTAISECCSGTPSVDDLQALPWRAQQMFVGWLSGVLLNPEA